METRRRLVSVLAASIATLVLSGCATLSVGAFAERGVDLNQYHTYAWVPTDGLSTGDPRLDNNPFFERRVLSSVDGQMARRGFEKTPAASAEVLVHYHASVTQAIDVGADGTSASCEGDACAPSVYEAGTLVIDLMDARSSRLLWRGWARGRLDGVIDNQQRMEAQVDEAVSRMMARLPRGL